MEKYCKHCGSELDFAIHGNRIYCGDLCYYQSKLDRNKTHYQTTNTLLKQFRQVENILKSFYSLYGSDKMIPADLLNNVGMNWTLFSATTVIDKMKANVI
ncbi:MAG: hypothetical protein NTZ59_09020, partial [Bacteroidetes bacterium]|nr:hypothetical protein [Bacteroidota bacterium]